MLTTMLFTDIEGSTRLARELGPAWREVLAEHNRVVAGAIAAHGGSVQRTAGDSFFALFDAPEHALTAARAAQDALALRVRMGVHTGVIERDDDELTGLDIHLAARVADAAHGGQIVVTDAARVGGFAFTSLGEHRLKDFPAPELLWQLGNRAFPPLRTEPLRPTNLPAVTRRLVGRTEELEAIGAMLTGDDLLVTVVGLGGTGKTRLAVAAAERLLSEFPGGVWLIQLAGLRDPGDVPAAIAAVFGVPDPVPRLRARPALLVLDNFEHLVDAAPLVAALLEDAPGTRALVTSQLPLRVRHERVFRLGPLPPQDAVALFAERAPSVDGEAICARLDGLPLAIELAAARLSVLTPEQLLARLDDSLSVLGRGPRDLPPRQQTLRAALEWTHALLTPDERTLLARLGVFAGPAALEAIEAVAGEAVDALSGLVDASLAQRVESREHGVRFTLPQAVRDFAAEQLGEAPAVRRALAEHLIALAEAAHFWLMGYPDADRAPLRALEGEVRPALDWTRAHAPALHRRLASSVGLMLGRTGRAREAYADLGFALEAGVDSLEAGWAAVVRAFAALTLEADGEGLMEVGVNAIRAAGDPLRLQYGLSSAGVYYGLKGCNEPAVRNAREALALARTAGHEGRLGLELCLLAQALIQGGRLDEAERLLDEAEPLAARSGDSELVLGTFRGDLAVERGDWALAVRSFADAVMIASTSQLILDLSMLTLALARLGDDEAALAIAAAAAGLAEATGETGANPYAAQLERALRAARERVGPERAAAADARGRHLPPRELAQPFRAPEVSPATR